MYLCVLLSVKFGVITEPTQSFCAALAFYAQKLNLNFVLYPFHIIQKIDIESFQRTRKHKLFQGLVVFHNPSSSQNEDGSLGR